MSKIIHLGWVNGYSVYYDEDAWALPNNAWQITRDPNFPHQCDYCGCDCFTGLNRIDHRYSFDAEKCGRK